MTQVSRLTKDKVKQALRKQNGNISATARSLKVDRAQLYRFFKKYPDVREYRDDIFDERLDKLEDKLFEMAMNDNIAALIFALKTHGKERGYSEKTITENDTTLKIKVVRSDDK